MINQTVKIKAPIKIIPSKNYYLVIEDADGIVHYFDKEYTDKHGASKQGEYACFGVSIPRTGVVSSSVWDKMMEAPGIYEFEAVKCDVCTHEWAAAFHELTDDIECPSCHNIVNYEIITPGEG